MLALPLHSTATQNEVTPPTYPELLLDDVQRVMSAPLRWQQEEWKTFAWSGLAVAGAAVYLDAGISNEMSRQPQGNVSLREVERFGAEYSLGVVGGFYIAGKLMQDATALAVAQDSLTASIIASGLITPAIKIATGRSRPYEDAGTADFQGLGASKLNSSFPSGHTTEAFALASVISSHYDAAWIQGSAYTVAGLVGVARMYHAAHYASDVLAGAMIGYWTGKAVADHKQSKPLQKVLLLPEYSRELGGLRLTGSF